MAANIIKKPLVSVILPVFNAERYIKDAIQSILDQTYTHIELIIINDASIDNSEAVIRSFSDARIKYTKHSKNQGLVKTLNEGLKLAHGEYIARMDADDISLPERLSNQVIFFEKNSDIGVLGTLGKIINENSQEQSILPVPLTDKEIKFGLQTRNCFIHGSVMFNMSVLKNYLFFYSNEYKYIEDFALWQKLKDQNIRMHNLAKIQYFWRSNSSNISKINKNIQRMLFLKIIENVEKDRIKVDFKFLVSLQKSIKETLNLLVLKKESFFPTLFQYYEYMLLSWIRLMWKRKPLECFRVFLIFFDLLFFRLKLSLFKKI